MAFKDSLTSVRYFTEADPYFWAVDNRPLSDLDARGDELADELDRRTLTMDVTGAGSPTVNYAPAGWTLTRNAVGDYTITHNFSSLAYTVFGNVINATVGIVTVTALANNSFSIKTSNSAGTATDMRFSLLVVRR